jgi:hypothetical protein
MTYLSEPAARAAEFDALNPIGTPVHYWLNVRHDEPHTGTIAAPAQPCSAHYNRPVGRVADDAGRHRTVPLNLIEPIRANVPDPCDICGHPKAGHGVRYKALHGDHEWCNPYGRLITDTATKPAARPEPEATCDCRSGEVCMSCGPGFEPRPAAVDPYQPVPDPETRRAWANEPQPDHERPTVLARIYNAAKKEGTNR